MTLGDRKHRESLDAFLGQVEKRMAEGERAYGDKSYSKEPVELCREIKAELEDVAGWASILWARVDELEKAVRK